MLNMFSFTSCLLSYLHFLKSSLTQTVANQDGGVQDFGFDVRALQESEQGRGEQNLLHLQGKRHRDHEDDAKRRATLKRQNRLDASSEETKNRKKAAGEKHQAVLEKYSSPDTVANICSSKEKCCSKKCLEVRVRA